MAAQSASLTINVIANAAKAKAGFKDAEKGAKGLKGEIGKLTEQFTGKMGLAAGLTAAATYAKDALDAFVNLAKKSSDLGKAWGTSAEQASRWVAVADDMGVQAESLTGAFKNINKNADSGVFEKYGIAAKDAQGNLKTANDVFLDTLDALNRIKDPTERARAGTELLGKAWGGVAPLVGKTREEYEKMLATVSGGQVITEEELKRAEQVRIAQDNLSDAFQDVQLAVGQMVATTSPLIDAWAAEITAKGDLIAGIFGQDAGAVSEVTNNLDDFFATAGDADRMSGALDDLQNSMQDLNSTWSDAVDVLGGDTTKAIDNAKRAFEQLLKDNPAKAKAFAEYLKDFAQYATDPNVSQEVRDQAAAWAENSGTIDGWIIAADGAITDQRVLNQLQREATSLMDGLNSAWETYLGLLDRDKAVENAKNALIELAYAVDDPTTLTNEFAEAQRQAAVDVAAFIKAAGDIPEEVQITMLADIAEGNLPAVYAEIDNYGKTHKPVVPVDVQLASTNAQTFFKGLEVRLAATYGEYYRSRISANTDPDLPARAAGGPTMGGTTYLVGEMGPELFTSSTSGTIIPNGAFGVGAAGGGDTSITVNMPAGANGDDVVRALQRWVRANGQLPLPVSSKTVR